MHAAVFQLTPILGAEKSKVPFYIAGGLLVAWALIVSLLLGMRRPDFPSNNAGERAVIAVTAVLVVAAVSTAVITSGASTKTASAATTASSQAPTSAPPSPANEGTSTPGSSTPAATPTATTGTPAPPSSPAARTTTTLKLAANPEGQLSYDTKQLSAKAGPVTITMANMSPVEHDVTVARGSAVLGATPTFQGGSRSLSLKLKPGTYTFYCSVPGHRQAGMEGTLTVSS
jgi:plastocyanin